MIGGRALGPFVSCLLVCIAMRAFVLAPLSAALLPSPVVLSRPPSDAALATPLSRVAHHAAWPLAAAIRKRPVAWRWVRGERRRERPLRLARFLRPTGSMMYSRRMRTSEFVRFCKTPFLRQVLSHGDCPGKNEGRNAVRVQSDARFMSDMDYGRGGLNL